ncbi:hypothetical protein BG844_12570 [Couchioplanes caeruleus subsp. caeruleus]|uniref:Lipoprotein n=2 Tax=Couchioplanes caeruleus TaxID=56438 RepID=A0A1K0FMH6_9ACTN|nr:hypothetical protein BG844_12570 [Couchioplanes caeruleus subsp. caeruleus]
MTTLRGLPTAAAAAMVVLLSACAQPGTGPGAGSPSSAPPAGGDGGLVLRITQTGGFAGPDAIAARLPGLSVYADGRVIFDGPVTADYPGPALPNVLERVVPPEQVKQLTGEAEAAGVREGTDFGQPGVADASTTEVTVVTDAGERTVGANALHEAQANDPLLTPAQKQAREKLRAFLDRAEQLASGPEARPYRPEVLAAVVRPYVEPGDDLPARPKEMQWPGPALPGEPLTTVQKISCVTATGAQRDAILASAKNAKAGAPWVSGGNRWAVTFRPLLPGESGCADLKAAR